MPEQRSRSSSEAVSLRELIERELAHLKEQTSLHFQVLEAAHEKSGEVLNERLSRMNEFREAMKDQAATFVTKTELNLRLESIENELQRARNHRSEAKGMASATMIYGSGLTALVAIALSILAMFK